MTIHTPPQSYMLRDIVEVAVAPSVSWMPQTIGWRVVAVIALACAIVWSYKSLQRWWSNRYRREAVASLDMMLQACKTAQETDKVYRQQISQDVYRVLKTVLSAVDPQTRPLYGQPFLQSLDAQSEPRLDVFASKWSHWPQSLLVKQNALDKTELLALIADSQVWVKQHLALAKNAQGEMSDA
ncbi:DUF4381 domain-containing protein [Vibrio superstes]|uniref:DUF4381 domain-containing protein n=1 Tax=Vibrio superstes NBRC 103154 TaxID=1219062 RepID=A0A511QKP9_9VIBR|nr:DUF4381 domain-containing protein [Vibrio superstes]GEM77895.1 hypothetical protein VSU01S_01400 [Vibrio superstes NBRC 103154]